MWREDAADASDELELVRRRELRLGVERGVHATVRQHHRGVEQAPRERPEERDVRAVARAGLRGHREGLVEDVAPALGRRQHQRVVYDAGARRDCRGMGTRHCRGGACRGAAPRGCPDVRLQHVCAGEYCFSVMARR